MHIITVVGDKKVGKTALCSLWACENVTTSYVSTLNVCHWMLPDLTVHDTPSDRRFCSKLDVYFQSTDVFVLVANKDKDIDPWWALIRRCNTSASWLFVWTGDSDCPKRRSWAKGRGIDVVFANHTDPDSVVTTLDRVKTLAKSHESRPERVPIGYYEYFLGGANHWLQCA